MNMFKKFFGGFNKKDEEEINDEITSTNKE